MSRHDWIIFATLVLAIMITVGSVAYYSGRESDHINMLDRRVEEHGVKLDDIDRRTSRIEGYLINLADGRAALLTDHSDMD